MDMAVTSKSKSAITNSESRLRHAKSEEKAQRDSEDHQQNNNAHLNQISFIPVYSKKSDMCHYFSDKGDGSKNKVIGYSSNSPPTGQKNISDQNEKLSPRAVMTHVRRRSVGFEDMTTMQSYFSNEKRMEVLPINSNMTRNAMACSKILNSENETNYTYGQRNRENSCISQLNQNSKMMKNANDQMQATKPLPQYKDKSSKRKSSLNRLDFIDFPITYSGISQTKHSQYKLKNSSSDEELDSRTKPQNLDHSTSNVKRKHNVSSSSTSCKFIQQASNEISHQNSSPVSKFRLLPKSHQKSQFKLKPHRTHSSALQLQKLSHSAGELETLTDDVSSTNKVCLSAQEFDACDSPLIAGNTAASVERNLRKHSSQLPPINQSVKNSNLDSSQHKSNSHLASLEKNTSSAENVKHNAQLDIPDTGPQSEESGYLNLNNTSSNIEISSESILSCLNLNDSFELKHIDSKSEEDLDVVESTVKMCHLDLSCEKNIDKVSEENYDSAGSDSGTRLNSILRKKYFEERRELHGILKPPPEDKLSKTPPSILKHRESSEEKDLFQQSDLHSILKKSASEDESYSSGLDIRPILKVSTDEDSPGGSAKPRPILKKRTSFSEECSFASYLNNELKPILKKKTPLSTDDQPRPILKSRRKSEDSRSTLAEFVASRPRAYSADMGIKSNHETKLNVLEQKTDDFCKRENQNL